MNTLNKTLFIVEDNYIYAKSLQLFLSDSFPSLTIKTFPTGEDCLRELTQDPEIIIVDYLLNSQYNDAATGLTIIRKIKATNPAAHVILLSGVIEFTEISKTISEEGSTYMQKDKLTFRKIETLIREYFSKKITTKFSAPLLMDGIFNATGLLPTPLAGPEL